MVRIAPYLILFCTCIIYSQSVDITLIANEGFLISGDSEKVLIDGMFNKGFSVFHTPSDSILALERQALSPFDKITAVLISHSDADHFNADFISEYMGNSSSTILFTTAQIVDSIKKLPTYTTLASRIMPGTGATLPLLDTTAASIPFKVFPLRHDSIVNPNGPPNMGFVFTINGVKLFHPGDGLSHNLSVYQNFSLSNDSIDIAFFPYWFFDPVFGQTGKEIVNYIKPKAIILMHAMVNKDSVYQKSAADNTSNEIHVYFLETTMKTVRFLKTNTLIDTAKTATKFRAHPTDNRSAFICNTTLRLIQNSVSRTSLLPLNDHKLNKQPEFFTLSGKKFPLKSKNAQKVLIESYR